MEISHLSFMNNSLLFCHSIFDITAACVRICELSGTYTGVINCKGVRETTVILVR